MEPVYIQQTYDQDYQHCFGCGPKNEEGLHIKSYPINEGKQTKCTFTPDKKFSGGHPHNVYGGMIAMLFDCHGTASAAYFHLVDKGLPFNEETVIRRFVTAHLEVDFRKPTPQGVELTVIAEPIELGERKVVLKMQLFAGDKLCAESTMVAVGL
ncbi:PaaI family thioesterase [Falsiporphyromonas endometrii]|uniref:PaaI family thioesterase n=1 Tax=Falsiporphyromonas endometrii TaxID=1387297 RepID=A0ABV9K881_9PORP